jgi:hypothetical protein
MELPIEIVGIIREFSKPRMKHRAEYNAAIQEIDARELSLELDDSEKQLQDSDKTMIKMLLCSDKADVVIQALVAFKDAIILAEKANEDYYEYIDTMDGYDTDEGNLLKWDSDDRSLLQEDSRNKLFVVLYGGYESDYGEVYWR